LRNARLDRASFDRTSFESCRLAGTTGQPRIDGRYRVLDPDYAEHGDEPDLRPAEPFRAWGWGPARKRRPMLAVELETFMTHVRRWFVAETLSDDDLTRVRNRCLAALDEKRSRTLDYAAWPDGTEWAETRVLEGDRGGTMFGHLRPTHAESHLDLVTLSLWWGDFGLPRLRLRPFCPQPFTGRWRVIGQGRDERSLAPPKAERHWWLRADGWLRTEGDPSRDRRRWSVTSQGANQISLAYLVIELSPRDERWPVFGATTDQLDLIAPSLGLYVRFARVGSA
jgi:hypothetical protein